MQWCNLCRQALKNPDAAVQPFVEEGHILLSFFPHVAYILLPLVSVGVVLIALALAYAGFLLLTS